MQAWLASVVYPVVSYLKPLPRSGPTGPVNLTRAEIAKVEREKSAIIPVGSKRLLVAEAEAEHRFRRRGLFTAAGIMIFLTVVIYLKIRQIES